MWWIVDGMNVIGSCLDGWWCDCYCVMVMLVERFEGWVIIKVWGDDVMVVFEWLLLIVILLLVVEVVYVFKVVVNLVDDEIVWLV